MRIAILILSIFICNALAAQITPTDYSNPQNWAAGKMKTVSPINYSPNFTIVGPDTSNKTIITVTPDTSSDYDVFFVYPTILTSFSLTPATYPINALNKGAANIEISYEATQFEQFGRLYAPYYRQGNLATFNTTTSYALQSAVFDTAVTDVLAAFQYYMENYNNGKKVILVAHSQGSVLLSMVLRQMEINPTYSIYLPKIFLSVLMGLESSSYISRTGLSGGWLQNIPACQNPTDSACVMSWDTHKYDSTILAFADSVPFDTDLVKLGLMFENFDSNIHRVFMDPLGFNAIQKPINFSVYPTTSFKNETGTDYGVTTNFIGYTNMYYGSISEPNDLSYGFMVERIPGIPNDNRADPVTLSNSNDLHIYDASVVIGNVICLIYEKMGKACPYNFISTGAEALGNEETILVFPNPATDKISIVLPNEKIDEITLYDPLGKMVMRTGKTNSLDISMLNSGTYLLAVTGNNKVWRKVILKI